jgi:phenylalanyl-tRNA synthetase alpha chain
MRRSTRASPSAWGSTGSPDLRDMFAADLRWMKHYGFLPLDVPTLAGGISG